MFYWKLKKKVLRYLKRNNNNSIYFSQKDLVHLYVERLLAYGFYNLTRLGGDMGK